MANGQQQTEAPKMCFFSYLLRYIVIGGFAIGPLFVQLMSLALLNEWTGYLVGTLLALVAPAMGMFVAWKHLLLI